MIKLRYGFDVVKIVLLEVIFLLGTTASVQASSVGWRSDVTGRYLGAVTAVVGREGRDLESEAAPLVERLNGAELGGRGRCAVRLQRAPSVAGGGGGIGAPAVAAISW